VTVRAHERFQANADPVAFLASVMRGEPMQVGDQAMFPTIEQRVAAASKLLDKVVPDAREQPISFPLDALNGPTSVLAAMSNVAERLSTGELPPSAATQMTALLGQYSKVYEVGVLEQRVSDRERGRRPKCEDVEFRSRGTGQ
jgi:hypothetical protein